MRGAEPLGVAAIGTAVEHRVADTGAGEPDPLEIRRLERQQRHQMVVPARHAPGAAGAPCPDHRRHIVDQRQPLAPAAQPLRDPPAEPGAVDRHHRVGFQRAHRRHGFAHPAQDQGGPRQHLGDPDHREVGERHQTVDALLAHALAADPGDPHPAAGALTQPGDQAGAERVARGLAGDDEDEG